MGQANWFDKELSSCIIALDKINGKQLIHHGTGFLLYNYGEPNKNYVATCEHVLRNSSIVVKIPATEEFRKSANETGKRNIQQNSRFWLFDGFNLLTEYKLVLDSTFVKDDSLDIGVFAIELPGTVVYNSDTIKITNRKSIPKSLMKRKNEIEIGTEIYFLGFPFSIGTNSGYVNTGSYSDYISNPLLRTGIVAWKSNNSKEFLLDAFSYGGNSGSPVFCKREVFGGTPYLIGMVIGHLTHPAFNQNEDVNNGFGKMFLD